MLGSPGGVGFEVVALVVDEVAEGLVLGVLFDEVFFIPGLAVFVQEVEVELVAFELLDVGVVEEAVTLAVDEAVEWVGAVAVGEDVVG